jgi:hypothetical protein
MCSQLGVVLQKPALRPVHRLRIYRMGYDIVFGRRHVGDGRRTSRRRRPYRRKPLILLTIPIIGNASCHCVAGVAG